MWTADVSIPHPATGFAALLRKECGLHWRLTAHFVNPLHPQSSPTPSIAVHGYTSSAVNSDRYGCRHKDCRAPFHYGNKLFILAATTLYPDTAPSSRCRARLHIGMSGNLRLLFRAVDAGLLRYFLHFTRTPYQSHVPPTHRGCSRLHSTPSALTPPRAPMNARQSSPTLRQECDHCTYSEQPAAHGTEGSAHSLRQAHDKEPVVP